MTAMALIVLDLRSATPELIAAAVAGFELPVGSISVGLIGSI